VQELLRLDAVGKVEQLALRADAGDRVGPLEAPRFTVVLSRRLP
jgi:hypothetical protein